MPKPPAAGHACGGAEAGAAGHVGHDVGEDEEEEQGVHRDADEEGDDFAGEDAEVALQEAEEGARVDDEFCVVGARELGSAGWGGHAIHGGLCR